jgi:RNA polymerase sigma-70 factor (ECF subfamily)
MPEETDENDELLPLLAAGDGECWPALVGRSRHRLRRMVAFRLDPRLRGRVDLSDVLLDAYLEAWRDLGADFRRPEIPFFLWLRDIAGNKPRAVHRHHLGTRMRDPRREVPIHGEALAETTTTATAAELLGNLTRASEEAVRLELKLRLQQAPDGLDRIDRQVLARRHFEQPSPAGTATALRIKAKAAGMRCIRAPRRLKWILDALSDDWLEP